MLGNEKFFPINLICSKHIQSNFEVPILLASLKKTPLNSTVIMSGNSAVIYFRRQEKMIIISYRDDIRIIHEFLTIHPELLINPVPKPPHYFKTNKIIN